VYSVGSDQKDDGGKERDPMTGGPLPDVTFVVER